jgi:CRISPR-associated protein Csd1
MYGPTPIRWYVDLGEDGSLRGFTETEGSSPRGKRVVAPHVQRTVAVKAKLLADNAEYVLGIARETSKPDRVQRCHQDFVETVERCAQETGEPVVESVLRFLQALDPEKLRLPDEFDPADTLTFRVGEVLPIDLPVVQRWWADHTTGDGEEAGPVMECLVCGESKPVERRLPVKLKRIPGGQASGTALVSANAGAFESYGLEASLISPICRDCGEAFAKAANSLLQDRKCSLRAGPAVYIFWTREGGDHLVADFLSEPDPDEVRELLASSWTGREQATDLEAEPFYAAALTASGGRVVIRDWIQTTVPRARKNLARFFQLQRLTDPDQPEQPRPYSVYRLGGATVRELKDLPAAVPRTLISFAVDGGRLPDGLLYEAVRRNRAEQRVPRNRAALIKMILASQDSTLEETMTELDLANRDPAYLCGRLFAVLEDIQHQAIPGAKATLIDRFFGSASAAPASVFGVLMRNAQPHLAKLRKDPKKQSAYNGLQEELESVARHLEEFPRVLNMRQQAVFSLGYYHQRAAKWERIRNAQEAKQAREAEAN